MRHVTGAAAPVHDWRGIAIKELTPAGADLPGSLVEVDVPAGIIHPVDDSATPARLLSFNVPAYDAAATEVKDPDGG